MRAAIYTRVSTDDQTTSNQLAQLTQVCANRNWTVVATFTDEGISGAKGRDQRPGFDALHKAFTRGEVDIVLAWSVDRLGRTMSNLIDFLQELQATDTALYLHTQGLDTTTPAGRAMFGMLSVFADFERSMIQARVKAGMARARSEGKHVGRPSIRSEDFIETVHRNKAEGLSNRAIATRMKCSPTTINRVLADA